MGWLIFLALILVLSFGIGKAFSKRNVTNEDATRKGFLIVILLTILSIIGLCVYLMIEDKNTKEKALYLKSNPSISIDEIKGHFTDNMRLEIPCLKRVDKLESGQIDRVTYYAIVKSSQGIKSIKVKKQNILGDNLEIIGWLQLVPDEIIIEQQLETGEKPPQQIQIEGEFVVKYHFIDNLWKFDSISLLNCKKGF
jgi:hypothetical protein